jgi:hypothetical protein
VGECKEKVNKRFSTARSRVRKLDWRTALEKHFIECHPNLSLDKKNIEVALISDPVLDDIERVNLETMTKIELKEATKHMTNVKVLNM